MRPMLSSRLFFAPLVSLAGTGAAFCQQGTRLPLETRPAHSLASPGHRADIQESGPVIGVAKISNEEGGFPDTLDDSDFFGFALATIGDLDGDGFEELAVGAFTDDDGGATQVLGDLAAGGTDLGAVWVLFLDEDENVAASTKISATQGGFTGVLADNDFFGSAVAPLGDFDGDGIPDLCVGEPGDDDGGLDTGALWVLLLESNGSVKANHKISASQGGFVGTLGSQDRFGDAVTALGDLDGDGVTDLAVGAPGDDDVPNRGAVWILFLNPDATVKAHQKVSPTQGGFTGTTNSYDELGSDLALLGDLDGDGVADLAVGAARDTDTQLDEGAVWVLFLRADGTVKTQQEIREGKGGFTGILQVGNLFGRSLGALGDRDGDGVPDLAVGAGGDSSARGAVWILLLRRNGTVKAHRKISSTQGGFGGGLDVNDTFEAVAAIGDRDGDGIGDLAVGAAGDDDGGNGFGAVWILFLDGDSTVKARNKLSELQGFAGNTLDTADAFGNAVAPLGDLDGDGVAELAVGAPGDDDGGSSVSSNRGAVWILFLDPDGTVRAHRKISDTAGEFAGSLVDDDAFGTALAASGDLDDDGVSDLVVGAPGDDDGPGNNMGAVWMLFLHSDGTVKAHRKISGTQGGFRGHLDSNDGFGGSVTWISDLDGDGNRELAVGAAGDDASNGVPSSQRRGAVWILFLDDNGTVRAHQKISSSQGGFSAVLHDGDQFGNSLAALGDLDGDGSCELAVGAPGDDGSRVQDRGAVHVLFLAFDGTVRRQVKISSGLGGFRALLGSDRFGWALGSPGDLDGDGIGELAVGATGDDNGGSAANPDRGAVWLLFLDARGFVKSHQKVSATEGGFRGDLHVFDALGGSVAGIGDLDGDGIGDLAVGSTGDDDGGGAHGALWLLSLDGIASIDFESGDDQSKSPLVDGQALSSPGEFGRTLQLAGSGANLGPAIFDSTPPDPGVRNRNGDLSVGLGNVLILQDERLPAETVPGIFDHPDDAAAGGSLMLSFRAPIEALSLDLIGVDKAFVVLFDDADRVRRYAVPPGWTGKLTRNGPPGFGTLDLTSLAPQPGFQSSASVRETAGFDPTSVVRVEIQLPGSGAIDNLRWVPHP